MEETYKCSCCREAYVEKEGKVCGYCEDFLYGRENLETLKETIDRFMVLPYDGILDEDINSW